MVVSSVVVLVSPEVDLETPYAELTITLAVDVSELVDVSMGVELPPGSGVALASVVGVLSSVYDPSVDVAAAQS
jgi:hypothetical protein